MKSSALDAPRELRLQRRHADVAVAADDLGEQPLLGPEVVVQQARARRRPRARRGRRSRRRRRAARRDSRIASTMRCAFSPSMDRVWVAAASIAPSYPGAGGGPAPPRNDEGRPAGAPRTRSGGWRAARPPAPRLGVGGGGVVELLLLAEERVEHLVAQVAARRRGPRPPRCRAAAACGPGRPCASSWLGDFGASISAEPTSRSASAALCRSLVQLLVVDELLRQVLAAAQALEGALRGLEGHAHVVAQVVVLDHALHVGVGLDRRDRLRGRCAGRHGLLLLRHPSAHLTSLWSG